MCVCVCVCMCVCGVSIGFHTFWDRQLKLS